MGFGCPITNVGHADLVDLEDGSWYAVMLGSRLIDGKYKNLGRETFICPVVWERDWPLFSPETGKVELTYDAPESLEQVIYEKTPDTDDFEDDKLPLYMVTWGTPGSEYYKIEDSCLKIQCIPQILEKELEPMKMDGVLSDDKYAAVIARRQCAVNASVTAKMHFYPKDRESAGNEAVQAMNQQLHIERTEEDRRQIIRVIHVRAEDDKPPYFPGFESKTSTKVLESTQWDGEDVILKLDMKGEDFTVYYGVSEDQLKELCKVDGALINPEKVGCMCGTLLGMYAT